MIHVTIHAMERFIERVQHCSLEEARDAILTHAPAIESAAAFACQIVRCGNGERLVLEGTRVITVYGARTFPRECRSSFRQEGWA